MLVQLDKTQKGKVVRGIRTMGEVIFYNFYVFVQFVCFLQNLCLFEIVAFLGKFILKNYKKKVGTSLLYLSSIKFIYARIRDTVLGQD